MKLWNSLVLIGAALSVSAQAQLQSSPTERKGFSFSLPNGGGATIGHVVAGPDNHEMRYDIGFDLSKAGKGVDTTFAFSVEAGFRKYLSEAGKVKFYQQPNVFASKASTGEFLAALTLGAGYSIGGEFVVSPNFTFGARTGICLVISKEFKAFSVKTGTSAVTATYYW